MHCSTFSSGLCICNFVHESGSAKNHNSQSIISALWNSGNIKRGSNLMFARKSADQTWHTPPSPPTSPDGT